MEAGSAGREVASSTYRKLPPLTFNGAESSKQTDKPLQVFASARFPGTLLRTELALPTVQDTSQVSEKLRRKEKQLSRSSLCSVRQCQLTTPPSPGPKLGAAG